MTRAMAKRTILRRQRTPFLEVEELHLPRRVSRKQLQTMRCKAKVLAIFGGV